MRCTWCSNALAKGNNCKITSPFCIYVKSKPHYLPEWLCTMHFLICTLTKYYSSDQIKKNKMRGTCTMYGRHERCIQGFDGET